MLDFGWPDTLAPPLERLCNICKSIESWLNLNVKNVVVLHCRIGLSRLSVVIAAYIDYSNVCTRYCVFTWSLDSLITSNLVSQSFAWLLASLPTTSLGNSGLCWTVFARNMDTAVSAEGNGDLQTLICVLVARPRRCLTLLNPVPWQNWMAAYLGYTLRMKTLFRGWSIMVNDTHIREEEEEEEDCQRGSSCVTAEMCRSVYKTVILCAHKKNTNLYFVYTFSIFTKDLFLQLLTDSLQNVHWFPRCVHLNCDHLSLSVCVYVCRTVMSSV